MTIPFKPEGPVQGYIAAFRFYDSKRRRLSIFARTVDVSVGNTHFTNGAPAELKKMLEITVLTLSDTPTVREHYVTRGKKKVLSSVELLRDTFSKKAGRKKYEEECISEPEVEKRPGRTEVIDIIEDRPRMTFLQWCNDRFYRVVEEEKTIKVARFVRGKNYVNPKKKVESKGEETA